MKRGIIVINVAFTLAMMFILILILLMLTYSVMNRNPEGFYCTKVYKIVRFFGLKFSDKQCAIKEVLVSKYLPLQTEVLDKFGDGDYSKRLYFNQNVNMNTVYIYIPLNSNISQAFVERSAQASLSVGDYMVNSLDNKVDFTKELELFMENECQDDPCTIPLHFMGFTNTELGVHNLHVEYVQLSLNYRMSKLLVSCWEKGELGNYEEDLFCDEIIITSDSIYNEPITEFDVTEQLKRRKLCHILPNNDYGCGDEDRINFENIFNEKGNIIIRYKNQKVVLE